jgi:hypothetical protein
VKKIMLVHFKRLLFIGMVASLAGCALTRSEIDISGVSEPASAVSPSNGKEVYINSINDKRVFQESPHTPDIPSLDPAKSVSDAIKLRAIGRKRNGFGKALGDILLKEGESIDALTAQAIRQAFVDKGYKVLDKSDQVTPSTYVVDADVDKFWTWMNPGFWALTISADISTDLSIKNGEDTQKLTVQVKSADHFQTGMDSNYVQVISAALKQYVQDLKLKLK